MTLKKTFIFFTSLLFLLSFSLTLFAGSNDDPESGFHITPTLQVVTDNSVGIMWESYNSDTGTIKVSTNSNMSGAITLSSSSSKIHKVTVNGLSENTRYYYTVSTDGAATSTKSFVTTLPKGDTSSFRFIVYGDTRLAPWYEDIVAKYGDNDDHLPVCQSMMSYSPDFLLHVGDFVYSGKDMDDIYNFFDVESDLLASYPVIPTYGNHEFKGGNGTGNTYLDSYMIPAPGGDFAYYSLNYGNAHIVVLNTGAAALASGNYDLLKPGSAQYQFLEADLQAASMDPATDHIFISMHVPLYSVAGFGDNSKLQNYLEPLFLEYGVKAVFVGHEHDYQHIERYGIHHILSGGAGSSMCDMPWHGDDADTDGNLIKYEQVLNYLIVDINGDSINFQARKVQGNGNNSSSVLESFSL